MVDRQCSSCGGFCKKSGCERENVAPKREWVGLTDKAKLHFIKYAPKWTAIELIEAIEIELKEKNGY